MSLDNAVDFRFDRRSRPEILCLNQEWNALAAEHTVMLRPKPHDFSLHSRRHYIALLNACRKDGETTVDGLPRSTLRDGRGKLIFIPAGCRMSGWAEPTTAPVAFTAAYIDPSICTWLGAAEYQLVPMLHFEHALLIPMMRHLDRILAQPQLYSRVYAESFAVVLLTEIMNCQAAGMPRGVHPQVRASGGLAGWRSRAVCEFIEDNLSRDISLTELAAIAELSPYHFCRAFKAAVGEPPHRYQMRRRVERAKALLAEPSLSVTDVATAVGYNSLSRFSAVFRKATGHSPRTYRQILR